MSNCLSSSQSGSKKTRSSLIFWKCTLLPIQWLRFYATFNFIKLNLDCITLTNRLSFWTRYKSGNNLRIIPQKNSLSSLCLLTFLHFFDEIQSKGFVKSAKQNERTYFFLHPLHALQALVGQGPDLLTACPGQHIKHCGRNKPIIQSDHLSSC